MDEIKQTQTVEIDSCEYDISERDPYEVVDEHVNEFGLDTYFSEDDLKEWVERVYGANDTIQVCGSEFFIDTVDFINDNGSWGDVLQDNQEDIQDEVVRAISDEIESHRNDDEPYTFEMYDCPVTVYPWKDADADTGEEEKEEGETPAPTSFTVSVPLFERVLDCASFPVVVVGEVHAIPLDILKLIASTEIYNLRNGMVWAREGWEHACACVEIWADKARTALAKSIRENDWSEIPTIKVIVPMDESKTEITFVISPSPKTE